jgi:nicotinamide-nucleotide amidase
MSTLFFYICYKTTITSTKKKYMTIWLLTIGDEILIGQIVDTNSAWMSAKLNLHGFKVIGKSSVGDEAAQINEGVHYALSQADVVITTGGLGPTKDDITKKVLAQMFGSEMALHQGTLDTIAAYFTRLQRPLPASSIDQATLPTQALILPNKVGAAPGMLFQKENKYLISLPGVPFEMEHLMNEQVLPALQERFQALPIVHRTILTSMEGESNIALRIEAFENSLPSHIKLAYLPGLGNVRLRLSAFGTNTTSETELTAEVETYKKELVSQIEDLVFGYEDQTLPQVIGSLLMHRDLRLGLAESCTGGYIAHQITQVPGASKWYEGSLVTYSNALKHALLGVPQSILENEGAVSEACVRAMAEGANARLGTDIAVSVSGILGPDGATADKSVGTVYIGIADREKTVSYLVRVNRDRSKNIQLVGVYALTLLYRFLLKKERV